MTCCILPNCSLKMRRVHLKVYCLSSYIVVCKKNNKMISATTFWKISKLHFLLAPLHKRLFLGGISGFTEKKQDGRELLTGIDRFTPVCIPKLFSHLICVHSLIRGVLIQSCSAGAENFTNYVFCHPQFSGVIQNIENRCAILTPVCLYQLLSK